jgi:hypothetical protein
MAQVYTVTINMAVLNIYPIVGTIAAGINSIISPSNLQIQTLDKLVIPNVSSIVSSLPSDALSLLYPSS